MKRYLQLLGEMRGYQLPQARQAIQEMEADDELVIVAPEQGVAEAIQQWATSQGYTVSKPTKSGEGIGIIRWHLTVRKATTVKEPASGDTAASPATSS
ncbi:MAG: sulfurtransferase TusA family protein [Candidatus Methylomirabilaceae bacterium]